MSAWANVATIGKAKNLKGGLLVYPREGLPFLLEEGMEVTFVPPVLRTPRTGRVQQISAQAGQAYLVFFDSIDSIELAERLQDHCCLVRRDDLPADFDQDPNLIGYQLIDPERQLIGRVVALEENPAHPLLVVERLSVAEKDCTAQSALKEEVRIVRVPFVQDLIVSIDLDEKTIMMDLPQGLLDI